jgi:prepilin-type N-terminal cleavage/methylation domain-containing protein
MTLSSHRRAFTLIELLIVIAVIGVLSGLLLMGVSRIKDQADRANCATHLRGWGGSLISFAADNQGHLPIPFFANGQSWEASQMWADKPIQPIVPDPNPGAYMNPDWNKNRENWNSEISFTKMLPYFHAGDVLKDAATGTDYIKFSKEFGCPRYIKERGVTGPYDWNGARVMDLPGYALLTGTNERRGDWAALAGITGTAYAAGKMTNELASGDKILMADQIFSHNWAGIYTLAYHKARPGKNYEAASVPVVGGHALRSDGSTVWRYMTDSDNAAFTTFQDMPASGNWSQHHKSYGGNGSRYIFPKP